MTFNVENLFDTIHDEGKNDYTFLPMAEKRNPQHRAECAKVAVKKWREECLNLNWSEKNLDKKFKYLTRVLHQVEGGKGPDVLVLAEVENKRVLEMWKDKHLKDMGYVETVLIEGDDERGIDVALLSKLPLSREQKLHRIPFKNIDSKTKSDTRGILDVSLKLPDGRHLTVFGVHFPAPFHPTELRRQALQFLNSLLEKRSDTEVVVAAGDFNITFEENKKTDILSELVRPKWIVAHDHCKGCLGTSYYLPKKSWSFLDMILVARRKAGSGWTLDTKSVEVVNGYRKQKTKEGYPKSFRWPTYDGVSDHFPLLLEIIADPNL